MHDFMKWAFSTDAPEWVQLFAITTSIICTVAWFGFTLMIGSLAMLAAPFCLGAYLVWKEYEGRAK